MTPKKKILYVIIGFITLFFLFLIWYKVTYSMNEATSYEINSPTNKTKLLIATQGSEFKNTITENIVNYYKKDSLYIKVIDVSQLDKINSNKFNAIFLFHTWENLKPPIEVETFIKNNKGLKSKIIIYTTSGNGSYKMKNVDALTGESKLEDIKKVSNQITKKLDDLL